MGVAYPGDRRGDLGWQLNDLRALQRWMLAAITGHEPQDAATVVVGSAELPAHTRLGVYARGYRARLLGHLRAEFPMLRELTGEDVFDLFALAYIAARPSTSHSLFDYGADFPDFLDETRPADGGDVAALPAAVARLDQLRRNERPFIATPAHTVTRNRTFTGSLSPVSSSS